mmetsp:Transcript_11033/g.27582  ORF Transcript_11033/g.27582 Transcript_11033/m.27582 type:complete len:280 (-) Transcript_11033:62-901(-)
MARSAGAAERSRPSTRAWRRIIRGRPSSSASLRRATRICSLQSMSRHCCHASTSTSTAAAFSGSRWAMVRGRLGRSRRSSRGASTRSCSRRSWRRRRGAWRRRSTLSTRPRRTVLPRPSSHSCAPLECSRAGRPCSIASRWRRSGIASRSPPSPDRGACTLVCTYRSGRRRVMACPWARLLTRPHGHTVLYRTHERTRSPALDTGRHPCACNSHAVLVLSSDCLPGHCPSHMLVSLSYTTSTPVDRQDPLALPILRCPGKASCCVRVLPDHPDHTASVQ